MIISERSYSLRNPKIAVRFEAMLAKCAHYLTLDLGLGRAFARMGVDWENMAGSDCSICVVSWSSCIDHCDDYIDIWKKRATLGHDYMVDLSPPTHTQPTSFPK